MFWIKYSTWQGIDIGHFSDILGLNKQSSAPYSIHIQTIQSCGLFNLMVSKLQIALSVFCVLSVF